MRCLFRHVLESGTFTLDGVRYFAGFKCVRCPKVETLAEHDERLMADIAVRFFATGIGVFLIGVVVGFLVRR